MEKCLACFAEGYLVSSGLSLRSVVFSLFVASALLSRAIAKGTHKFYDARVARQSIPIQEGIPLMSEEV